MQSKALFAGLVIGLAFAGCGTAGSGEMSQANDAEGSGGQQAVGSGGSLGSTGSGGVTNAGGMASGGSDAARSGSGGMAGSGPKGSGGNTGIGGSGEEGNHDGAGGAPSGDAGPGGDAGRHETGPTFHVFLLLGQSNMAGYPKAQDADKVEKPRIKVLGYDNCAATGRQQDKWDVAVPPLHECWNGAIGPGDYFSKTLIDKIPAGDTIGLVPCAISGEKIETFLKTAARSTAGSSSAPSSRSKPAA